MNRPRLVLASRSPRRRDLLRLLRLPFEIAVSDVPEKPQPDETPIEMVVRLSRSKAEEAQTHQRLAEQTSNWVIACDTIVVLEDGPDETRILGKPEDSADAAAMLRLLRGRSHAVYSAVTLLNDQHGPLTELAKTRLTMRDYTEEELTAYVATGDPLDKAGSYAIQHEGFDPVEEIEGCYASVMGLPLCDLARCMCHYGFPPPADVPAACQAYTGHRCGAAARKAYEEIRQEAVIR